MEWDAAQTVTLWCDAAQAMQYSSAAHGRTKAERAKLLALALSVLLTGAGERVALMDTLAAEPRGGEAHLRTMALALSASNEGADDYGTVPAWPEKRGGQAVFLSDFLGSLDGLEAAMDSAAQRGVGGILLQINDPAEEAFPFDGRLRFRSMAGVVDFETERARGLRDAYVAKLTARRAQLADMARGAGWQFNVHRTSDSPRKALLWLYTMISGVR
jgi:uncharacterized protein (DUF58 family)